MNLQYYFQPYERDAFALSMKKRNEFEIDLRVTKQNANAHKCLGTKSRTNMKTNINANHISLQCIVNPQSLYKWQKGRRKVIRVIEWEEIAIHWQLHTNSQQFRNFHKLMHLCNFPDVCAASFLKEHVFLHRHLHFNNQHACLFICRSSAARGPLFVHAKTKGHVPGMWKGKREWHPLDISPCQKVPFCAQTVEVIVRSTFWSLA